MLIPLQPMTEEQRPWYILGLKASLVFHSEEVNRLRRKLRLVPDGDPIEHHLRSVIQTHEHSITELRNLC